MDQDIKQKDTKVYKVIIVILAIAIVLVGALFAMKIFADPGANSLAASGAAGGGVQMAEPAGESTTTITEKGNSVGIANTGGADEGQEKE